MYSDTLSAATDPLIYLYRQKNLTGVASKVVGVQVYGDGLIRLGTAGFAA